MPHSSTQRRRMVTAFLRRGSMPAHAVSRVGCLRARSAILRNSSSPSGSHSVGKYLVANSCAVQLLTAVAADVDTEVRGESFPEWLREPLALHQVVVRVDDDGHETAGSLP